MVEKVYQMVVGDDKTIERVIADENLHFNHMILNKGEALPEHFSNSTVYMSVVRGVVTLMLDDQVSESYEAGKVLKIPFNTKMNVMNNDEKVLELYVVKAPAPKN
ncbi:MAG: cupin domain-containing protein [Spirochaetales bacterium]|nr:cupin domain-containing protein [Spirochaetales bacterium]